MISYVWSADYPFLAGAGGSENYTAGQIRELQRRGIPCRIITLGYGEDDGRDQFPDIQFKAIDSVEELAELDDTIIFITYPLRVTTKQLSYVILHCPPPVAGTHDPLRTDRSAFAGKRLIVPSRFAAKVWARYLGRSTVGMHVVPPFAENDFGRVSRPITTSGPKKFLFAGRLTPEKGIYTLLAALHMSPLSTTETQVTVTTSGAHTPDGKIVQALLQAHPRITLTPARPTAAAMAQLMAAHDVLVMPTTDQFWKETFGIVSVEAQHAGCRVVASRTGGIPETNCGGVLLVRPDEPVALANGMAKAAELGPLSSTERRLACQQFTVAQSVDALLSAIGAAEAHKIPRLHGQPGRLSQLYPQLGLFGARSRS